jgi:hypothetical protein
VATVCDCLKATYVFLRGAFAQQGVLETGTQQLHRLPSRIHLGSAALRSRLSAVGNRGCKMRCEPVLCFLMERLGNAPWPAEAQRQPASRLTGVPR